MSKLLSDPASLSLNDPHNLQPGHPSKNTFQTAILQKRLLSQCDTEGESGYFSPSMEPIRKISKFESFSLQRQLVIGFESLEKQHFPTTLSQDRSIDPQFNRKDQKINSFFVQALNKGAIPKLGNGRLWRPGFKKFLYPGQIQDPQDIT